LSSLLLKLKKRIHNPIFFDSNRDYTKTIVLAGVGRGGTTWVSEILNFNNSFRYIFEPLKGDEVQLFKNFSGRKYIPRDCNDKTVVKAIDKLVKGEIRSYWTDHYNKKLITNKRLIKVIRGNLTLHYIKNKYPEIPIVLLLRHPFDTASSHNQRGWNINFDQHFFHQQRLVDDYFKEYIDYCYSLETIFEKQVAMWCLENYIPLKQFKKDEIHIALYEHLICNPEEEIKQMFSFCKINYDEKVLQKIKTPSRIVGRNASLEWGKDLIYKWKDKLSEEQVIKGFSILERFGLDKIYLDKKLPSKIEVQKLLEQ